MLHVLGCLITHASKHPQNRHEDNNPTNLSQSWWLTMLEWFANTPALQEYGIMDLITLVFYFRNCLYYCNSVPPTITVVFILLIFSHASLFHQFNTHFHSESSVIYHQGYLRMIVPHMIDDGCQATISGKHARVFQCNVYYYQKYIQTITYLKLDIKRAIELC
jgi:hypothetical protein